MQISSVSGPTKRQLAYFMVLVAVGVGLRLARIDRSFWFDELYTMAQLTEPSFRQLIHQVSLDANNPPLFSVLSYFWVALFGNSEFGARSLPFLASLVLLASPWLATSSLSRSEKWLATTLLALWYLPIRYAQEMRVYSLMLCFAGICFFSYLENLSAPTRGRRISFHVSLILLGISHIFGLMLALSYLATMFLFASGIRARIGLALYALVLAAVVAVPMIHFGILTQANGKFWIPFTVPWLATQFALVVTPIGALLLLLAVRPSVWKSASKPQSITMLRSLLPYALLLAGAFLLSLNTPVIIARNLIALTLPFAFLVSLALGKLLQQRGALVAYSLLGLLAVQAVALEYYGISFNAEDFRSVAKLSVAKGSPACYMVSATESYRLQKLYGFYVDQRLGRPDLAPRLEEPSFLKERRVVGECDLWSAVHVPGFEFSSSDQFGACAPVNPGTRAPNLVLSCGLAKGEAR
jgi:hypothetical protein